MKKILIISAIMLLIIITIQVASAINANVGDVDSNDEITLIDARLALRYAVKIDIPNSEQLVAVDVNGDGIIKIAEARQILRWAMQIDILPIWATYSESAKQIEGEELVKKITAYTLTRSIYNQFLNKPSLNILNQQENETEIYVYYRSTSDDVETMEDYSSDTWFAINENTEGICRIANLPVYGSLIDFVSNVGEMEKYLLQNDITGKVEDVAIISSYTSPVTIWIRVNQEDFFITINEYLDDFANNFTYVYRLYNYLAYYEKFSQKDATLIVNNTDITEGSYVKIQYKYVYLPLITIMDALEANIEWSKDSSVVEIKLDGKKYILDTINRSFFELGKDGNYLLPPPGGFRYYNVIDEEIIVDSDFLKTIFEQVGVAIVIDYESLVVNIIKE